jgi:hypothetical protein
MPWLVQLTLVIKITSTPLAARLSLHGLACSTVLTFFLRPAGFAFHLRLRPPVFLASFFSFFFVDLLRCAD